jgi:hypothetical protein
MIVPKWNIHTGTTVPEKGSGIAEKKLRLLSREK